MPVNTGLKLDIRRNKILDLLGREGKVRVIQLSQLLDISEVTIRNDLSELEKGGYLRRVPGGAVQTIQNYYNMDFQQRKQAHAPEKTAIGRAVATLIKDGETLMINSGTTTFFAALELKKLKNLKIVTNSILIAAELGGLPTFRVILLGGDINTQFSFSYGDDALNQLKKYKADKLILSVDGVRPDTGLTTYHAEEREVNRMMIERSNCTIVIADYTKIGSESFSVLGGLETVDYLVTNQNAPVQMLDEIEKRGVAVIRC
jgi:DeoR/GlpR family transcriptional regulator of sugar metabolism